MLAKMVKSGAERAQSYRETNGKGAKLSQMKYTVKMAQKRSLDDAFHQECKRKSAERKRKYRARKFSEKENISDRNDLEMSCDNEPSEPREPQEVVQEPQKSRQALMGLLQRKKTNREKNDSIAGLRKQLKEMEKRVVDATNEAMEASEELKKSESEVANLKGMIKQNDLWLKNTYKYCRKETKEDLRTSYQIAFAAKEIPKGTTLSLLKNTGINFSKKSPEPESEKSDLKKLVELFANKNSTVVPDMRLQKKGIRYRHQYLTCLFEDFKFVNPEVKISYSTFSSYWPKSVIKPRPGDFGTCLCDKCENPNLKIHAMKTHKLIPQEVEIEKVLRDIKNDDFASEDDLKNVVESLLTGPKASVQVRYLQWEKVENKEINENTGRKKQAVTQRMAKFASAKKLAMDFLSEFDLLRDHLERNELIKNFVKSKREEVLESDDKVMLHVDWAENGTIIVPNEIQTAFYGGRTNYSMHSGYQYAKENSGGFVSLSDD